MREIVHENPYELDKVTDHVGKHPDNPPTAAAQDIVHNVTGHTFLETSHTLGVKTPSEIDRQKSLPQRKQLIAGIHDDARNGLHTEFRRRGSTLQDYYKDHPEQLPHLPFTWRRGWKRFRLGALIFLIFLDACVAPIVLYYAMTFVGHVESYITFAIVTTIWGGPTYLEFAIRTLRLIRKERFYRPLGTQSRWCLDLTTYISIVAIAAVTILFVVGGAPHVAWLRVLCMPAPALLFSLGGSLLILTIYHARGIEAPFRLSSTPKGGPVRPGVYYILEDVVAVNGGTGRPYREALAARYEASPRFRRMIYLQSLFWSIPAVVVAIALTIVAVIHAIPAEIAYGICWAVPFVWSIAWSIASVIWVQKDLEAEQEAWESDAAIPLANNQRVQVTVVSDVDTKP